MKEDSPVQSYTQHAVIPKSGDEEVAVLATLAVLCPGSIVERDLTHTTALSIG